ncbi:hypothetical protein RND81_01G097800, partial [Saponaria officinalis]
RGLNAQIKQQDAVALFRQNNLDILGLLETRVRTSSFNNVFHRCFRSFQCFNNYAYHSNGCIWVLWNKSNMKVQLIDANSQWIHLLPWLVVGDFNCVRSTTERISSSPPDLHVMLAFNDALYAAGLDDIATHGCHLTWTNKQDDCDRKWMRLDRAVTNATWHSSFPASYADALPAGVSDHSPIVVTLCAPDPPRPKPFRFLNCWAQDSPFMPMVTEAWAADVWGCPMFCLISRLKALKIKFKLLHKSTYSGISDRIADRKRKLTDCQISLHSRPLCQTLLDEERDLCQAYCKFKNIELSIVYQRAKAQDIRMGDASTSFFFAKVAARRKISSVARIKDIMGHDFTSFNTISDAFISYYKKLLGTSSPVTPFDASIIQSGPCPASADHGFLTSRVTDEEIKAALFAIDANKSPGPDGYTSCFFKAAWGIISDDFTRAIREFSRRAKFLSRLTSLLSSWSPRVIILLLSRTSGPFRVVLPFI